MNTLLSAITPSVLCATTVEEMNTILYDGIYIISSRFGTQPLLRSKTRSQPKPKQHDRALKEVTRLKNEARRALRKARREGESVSTVQSLSGKFLSLLCDHSRLKRESSRKCQAKEASAAREDCHRNFWRYAKGLLDGNTTSQTSPKFSATAAHSYFSEVYECSPHHFQTPPWMSSPLPDCSMDMSPITPEELSRVIKKSRSSSAPSPLDRISYLVLKKCSSLHPALLHLFNRVIMEGTVPSAWKLAAVPKGAAEEDPSTP